MPAYSHQRFPVGTPIIVSKRRVEKKGGVDIEHHQKVYRGPERRSNPDRRAQMENDLKAIVKELKASSTAKGAGDLSSNELKAIELRLLNKGRRSNEGYRVLRATDVENIYPKELHRRILSARKSVESSIAFREKKGMNRGQAIANLMKDYPDGVIRDSSKRFIGMSIGRGVPSNEITLHIVYNPITKETLWVSTRRKIMDRREEESNRSTVRDEPSGNTKLN